ncbi:type VI secretion system protein TssA [Undibacterium sp.]|uniref:type VI secretion system protein TssA n=1 Tax=Undibacterium sp. TaxID=1914977 RepID=UPI00374CF57F
MTMFDVKKLLEPIGAPQGCGEDLSFSRELDAIVEARRFEDSSLDQGEWVTEVKTADWPFVIKHCASLIESRSKDLRLAVWLTEASVRVGYFAGLASGYQLLAGMFDQYWEGMYPLPEDGDQDQRVGNLSWILARSTQLVKEIPVTEGRDTSYSIIDFDAARARAANAEKIAAEGGRPEEGPKLADLDNARRKSSRVFFEKLLHDAQASLAALQQLEQSVDARLGVDGPGFSAARDALQSALKAITRFAQEAGVQTGAHHPVEEDALMPQDSTDSSPKAPAALAGPSGSIQTRTQALAQLRAVADFFRRTEPHSPVAYLADKAAHWGEMPLHTWLSTVIKDAASLSHVEELLGLRNPPENQ